MASSASDAASASDVSSSSSIVVENFFFKSESTLNDSLDFFGFELKILMEVLFLHFIAFNLAFLLIFLEKSYATFMY